MAGTIRSEGKTYCTACGEPRRKIDTERKRDRDSARPR